MAENQENSSEDSASSADHGVVAEQSAALEAHLAQLPTEAELQEILEKYRTLVTERNELKQEYVVIKSEVGNLEARLTEVIVQKEAAIEEKAAYAQSIEPLLARLREYDVANDGAGSPEHYKAMILEGGVLRTEKASLTQQLEQKGAELASSQELLKGERKYHSGLERDLKDAAEREAAQVRRFTEAFAAFKRAFEE